MATGNKGALLNSYVSELYNTGSAVSAYSNLELVYANKQHTLIINGLSGTQRFTLTGELKKAIKRVLKKHL